MIKIEINKINDHLNNKQSLIKLRLLILFFAFFSNSFVCINAKGNGIKDVSIHQQNDIDTLSQRLTREYHQLNTDVDGIIKLMASDGSWKDVYYGNDHIDGPIEHVKRLKQMTIAYTNISNTFYHSTDLLDKIELGFNFIYNKEISTKNWWFKDIGIPNEYMVALLLMKGSIPKERLSKYANFLKDATENSSHRGENRIWVSTIIIYKGCAIDDYDLIVKGFSSIASTLAIAEDQGLEGIKNDGSFHQHRPQLYSGGYGKGFATGIADIVTLAYRTEFSKAFTPEKMELLSNLMLNGLQLFGYREAIDFGTIGRNITRPDAIKNIEGKSLDRMAYINPVHSQDFMNWKSNLSGKDFPEKYQGNKYFWKSDIMTQHGAKYYLSAKVISTRTVGTEMLNGENLKGYNLPLGATNILTSGYEYKNIAPVWDWNRIPGTTAVQNNSASVLSWYLFGSNNFSGGVSNGKQGLIAYENFYNGVQANKAYIFTKNLMVCLGGNINAYKTQQVVTSVNQCLSNGLIEIGLKSNISGSVFTDSIKTFKDLKWVYHDNVGYIFPSGGQITLKNGIQTGSWKSINEGGSSKIISESVFSLWFNHGTEPKDDQYLYIVVPGKTLEQFKDMLNFADFKVIQNDSEVQVLSFEDEYFIVFHQPSKVDLGVGLSIEANKQSIIILKRKDNKFSVFASDPTHQQKSVNISIQQKTSKSYSYGTLNLDFASGENQGRTSTGKIELKVE